MPERFKEFPSQTQKYEVLKFINQSLSPEQLTQIQVVSTIIDFKEVFIKSKKTEYFIIKNGLGQPIKVQMVIKDIEELYDSYTKPQIIPAEKQTGFRLTVQSLKMKKIKESIGYIINDKHFFNLQILAMIIPV